MLGKAFLDTNVLIYLYAGDDESKRSIVCRVLDDHDCVTSIQALSETSNVLYKKFSLDANQIKTYLDNIESVCISVIPVHRDTINTALVLKNRYGYAYYDCLMLASALDSNCKTIYTEDMNNGQIIEDTLMIINPFQNKET